LALENRLLVEFKSADRVFLLVGSGRADLIQREEKAADWAVQIRLTASTKTCSSIFALGDS
jgi:hypothetical protein